MSDPMHSPVTKAFPRDDIARRIAAYSALHDESGGGTVAAREAQSGTMTQRYHDLVTDFYE